MQKTMVVSDVQCHMAGGVHILGISVMLTGGTDQFSFYPTSLEVEYTDSSTGTKTGVRFPTDAIGACQGSSVPGPACGPRQSQPGNSGTTRPLPRFARSLARV